MDKIFIVIFNAYVYPLFRPEYPQVFGGAEVDLYNLALYLAKQQGFEVTFYVGDFGQPEKEELVDGVRLVKIPYYGWHRKKIGQKIFHYSSLFKSLWESKGDIMLTEQAGDMVGWGAIFYKILRKKHLIHRLASDHDTVVRDSGTLRGWRTDLLYMLGLKKADMIFCQTGQQKKMLYTSTGLQCRVVPNGFFIYGPVNFEKKNHILWVGRCTALKRPELFVDLARSVPDKKFVMIMPPPVEVETSSFKERADKIVALAKALPNMTFIETVPFVKIQRYFDQAMLLINTSVYEGFPNTFIQACLGGTPIASLRVDPDGFIARNKLGIACADDFDRLVKFVKELDDRKILQLGQNAQDYVRLNHDIRTMGGSYVEVINRLMGGDKEGRQLRADGAGYEQF